MRRTIVVAGLLLMIAAGCWAAANHSPADVGGANFSSALMGDTDAVPQDRVVSGAPDLDPPLEVVQGEHHEVFDLLRNRPLGHRLTRSPGGNSVWLDAGHPDFVRYVQGNHGRDWSLDVGLEGDGDSPIRAAAVRGRSAALTVPAIDEDKGQWLEMRVFNPAQWDNQLQIEFNGQPLEPVTLDAPGWQTVVFLLDDAEVRADNAVTFEFSNLGRIEGRLSGGAVAWLRVGPDDGRDHFESPHSGPVGQGALRLEPGEGLFWPIWLHDDALLELDLEAEPGCGIDAVVSVEGGSGTVREIESQSRRLVAGRGATQSTTVNPSIEEEQVARLELAAHRDEQCQGARLHRARLIRPGQASTVPLDFEPPKYVVFWIIDTLRADYLPLHFDTDVQTPNLDRLAAGGVSFANAYVQGTESRASHASLFTGLYPNRHGVMSGGRVSPQLPILPDIFGDQGFATGLVAGNGYVSHLLNLDRGWDHYRNMIHEETAVHAQYLLDDGLRWIDGLADEESFFLYLGTIDPHATYRRHDEFIGLYEPDDYSGRFQRHLSGETLGQIKARPDSVTEREKERIINLYKNEITYNDHVFGTLREALEEKGIWEDTLVVITSDHGEEFWEHGSVGHGHNVHQEMVHVPLIFHYPRQLPQGRVVEAGAEVIDILPTMQAMFGMEPLGDRQGKDLLPLMYGVHGGYPSPALATQYMLEYGLQVRHWKLYLRRGGFRLYDRRHDPLELEDVRRDHPLASRWLQDALGWFRAYRAEWDKSRWGVATNLSAAFSELIEAVE